MINIKMFTLFTNPLFLVYFAFAANIAVVYAKDRPQLLFFAAMTSGFYGIYSFLEISATGGIISAISVVNIIYQAYVSEDNFEKSKIKRLCVTIACAVIGTALLVKSSSDLLPLMAFITLCVANNLKSPHKIKLLYMMVSILWGCYSLMHQDLFSAATNFMMIFAFMHKFYLESSLAKARPIEDHKSTAQQSALQAAE